MNYYAHTATTAQGGRDRDCSHWQPLRTHLLNVAAMARSFADTFGSADEAEIAGLLHDLGKYSARFQARLSDPSIRGINHWAAGTACAAARKLWAAAFAIDGHHTGIPALNGDGATLRTTVGKFNDPTLRPQVTGCPEALEELLARFETDGLRLPPCQPAGPDPFAGSFHARMLFSCLVDADFLDTEEHFDPAKSVSRTTLTIQSKRAEEILQAHLSAKAADGPVNAVRRQLLEDCLEAAPKPPGLFTLTAPTGSGKTLSCLAFALRHINYHNALWSEGDPRRFRRIIVVIPYTSIIEQTARVYREELFEAEFGPDYVLEHHSAVAPRETQTRDAEDSRLRRARLAAENWASPLIVTTSVQFFESLFSNRPSDCRKLHNIARSVVLFDEVQTLPLSLVYSLLSGVSLLARDYGVTAVFMTATQPAFASLNAKLPYGWNPSPIASNEAAMANILRRTRIELPPADQRLAWPDVASSMSALPQCLCVVNTTKDARELFRLIRSEQPEGAFHLSARMCPAHRLEKLALIRRQLQHGRPCRLVATQLIEAGVDVDFPAAWRALGPLDSIIQTAGRCNREGRSPEPCPVIVFRPVEDKLPPGAYTTATRKTAEFLARHPDAPLHQPGFYSKYFSELYALIGPGSAADDLVFKASKERDFPEAAAQCKLFGDETRPVLVKWGRGLGIVEKLQRRKYLTADECREAQRFSVNLYHSEFMESLAKGYLYQPAQDWDIHVWNSDYDEDFGLGHIGIKDFSQ